MKREYVHAAVCLVLGLMAVVVLVKAPQLRVPEDCQSLAGVRKIPPALQNFSKSCDHYFRSKFPNAQG